MKNIKENIDLFIIVIASAEKKSVTRKTYIENENLKGKSNPIARGLNIYIVRGGEIIRKFSPG